MYTPTYSMDLCREILRAYMNLYYGSLWIYAINLIHRREKRRSIDNIRYVAGHAVVQGMATSKRKISPFLKYYVGADVTQDRCS